MTAWRRLAVGLPLCIGLADCAAAAPRSYLGFNGGVNVLTTNNVGGLVVSERVVGQVELAIGTHLGDDFLLEGSYGFLGTQQQTSGLRTIPIEDARLPEHLRTFRLEVNPLMFRLRWAKGELRRGYLKPEFSVGAGLYSVSRWLRPIPSINPEVTSELLAAFEVGVSALFVFGENWMGYVGPRYTLTQRTDLVDDVDHLDGFSFLLGFRFFLNSPRDEMEAPDS